MTEDTTEPLANDPETETQPAADTPIDGQGDAGAEDSTADAAPADTDADADAPATVEDVPVAHQGKEDVVHYCYDNEHAGGVLCTLTFKDGSTASGTAPSTGDLAADQAIASAAALASVTTPV